MHSLIMSRPLVSFEYLVPGAAFLDIQARNEDVERFVRKKIDEVPTLRAVLRGKEASKDQLCAAIKESSHGMFLVARLQVEALKGCTNVTSLTSTLQELPTGVNDLYLHTLDRIESQGPQKALLARKTFLWATYGFETLKIQQLQEALAVSLVSETFDEDSIVTEELIHDVCCGLISLDCNYGVRFIQINAHPGSLSSHTPPWPPAALSTYHPTRLHHSGISHVTLMNIGDVTHALLLKKSRNYHVLPYANWWIFPEPVNSGHLAALLGLKSYLSRHVEVTATNRYTLLHIAAIGGSVDTAGCCLARFSATNRRQCFNETAPDTRHVHRGCKNLLEAAHRMNFQAVQEFLSQLPNHEIDPNAFAACGCNLLVCASRSGDEDTVHSILPFINWHDYPNKQDCKFGRTALLWASYFGHDSLVQLFLSQQGVSVHHRDKQGNTALMLAASGGHEDVIRSLLASPRVTKVNARNWNRDTAASLAEWHGYKDIAHLLGLRSDLEDSGDDVTGISEILNMIITLPGPAEVITLPGAAEEGESKQGELDLNVADAAPVSVGSQLGPSRNEALLTSLLQVGPFASFRSIFLFLVIISIPSSSFVYFALRIDAGYDMLAGFWKSEFYSVSIHILSCLCVPLL
ncbi:hypothetical protein H1R20_g3806, partial [Candolleomyces eurysporus]